MYLTLILYTVILSSLSLSASFESQLTRCKTTTGHSGLCVAGRFCRVRSIKLSPCEKESSSLLCCPFPSNDTYDRSLEDRETDPIVFPSDVSTSPKPHFDVKDSDFESVEIVFPADEVDRKELPQEPRISPTSYPSTEAPITPKIFPKEPQTPSETKPKILNPNLERNPKESDYNSKDDRERRIPFEFVPIPKKTTPKTTPNINELTTAQTTPGIPLSSSKTSYSSLSPTTKKYYGGPDLPVTTASILIEKITQSSINNDAVSKAFDTACGSGAFSHNIAGGTESEPNQWPWMTAIFQRFTTARPNKFLCGGSLINTRYIITAAHCCVSAPSNIALPASSFLVRMGSNAVHEGDNFSIAKVKIHSNFSFTAQFNDIALLRLTTDLLSYTNRIAPVCLPYPTLLEADLVDQKATVIGWGASYLGGEPQENLHEVSVPIVSTDDCALAYSRLKTAAFLARGSTHVLCAGLKEGGKDSCKSDSGGPLMMQLKNESWTIIGVVSFGYRCAEPGFPGVYTRITHYLEWIYSNTQD